MIIAILNKKIWMKTQGPVHKVKNSTFNSVYIEETKWKLKIRLNQHEQNISKGEES